MDLYASLFESRQIMESCRLEGAVSAIEALVRHHGQGQLLLGRGDHTYALNTHILIIDNNKFTTTCVKLFIDEQVGAGANSKLVVNMIMGASLLIWYRISVVYASTETSEDHEVHSMFVRHLHFLTVNCSNSHA